MSPPMKIEGLSRQEKLALLARLARRKQVRRAPLSFAQQRLWFLDRLDPGSHVHTIFRAYRLRGPLAAPALARAFAALQRRHDALRTTFVEHAIETGRGRSQEPSQEPSQKPSQEPSQEVFQQVAPAPPGELADLGPETWTPGVVDLSRLPRARRAELLEELAARLARKSFDLAAGPLARAALVRLDGADHGLLLALHHIVADGWSLGILFAELAELYGSLAVRSDSGEPEALPELPGLPQLTVQYPDYARWQREELDLTPQLEFWQKALAGAPTVLELPGDRPRPAVESFRGEYFPIRLPAELRRGLEELGRRHGATLFMTFLAGFAALLHRHTGRSDLLLATPVANRQRAELEGVVGSFANTLVLRADLRRHPTTGGDELTFEVFLKRLRRHVLDALAHQDLPFERLVEALEPRRDLSRNPVFQVMFALLQTAGGGAFTLPGLDTEAVPVGRALSKVDLTLEIYPDGDGLGGYIEYAADLFDETTIERLAGHLEILLAGAIARPGSTLAALPLLGAAETRQILDEWNQNPVVAIPAGSLPELWAARVRATPDAPALVVPGNDGGDGGGEEGGEEVLSFAQLDTRAGRVAARLVERGVGPGDRVALLVERSAEALAAILGVLETGAAYVALDPAYPPARLAFMIEDAAVAAVLTQERLASALEDALAAGAADQADRDPPVVLLLEPLVSSAALPRPTARSLPPASAAYLIYTSGSTGRPKGVVVPHRAVAHLASAMGRRYELAPGDRVLQFASLSFDISVEEIFPTLLAGATLVLRPPELSLAVADFFRFAAAHRLSVVNVPTPYWHEWISELATGRLELPPALRLVIVGTEQALPERLAGWLEVTGGRPRWINAYGPSETTVTATAFEATVARGTGKATGAARKVERVPIGRPIPNARAYVLDRHRRPVATGVPGQLWLAGAGLAEGYFHRPALTAERFGPDPFVPDPLAPGSAEGSAGAGGGRLYATGDLARWLPDGHLEFLGRVDRQVKIRGFRIETGEIEAALVEHPGVRQAVVEALPAGAGDRKLVAWVETETDLAPDASELREHLGRRLPAYMIPAAFVSLAQLPLTPSGKIDRAALPAPEGAEAGARAAGDWAPGEAPRGAVEELVAEVWAQVLERPAVGRSESFFELGGHSLLATRILARLRQLTGAELPLRTLFEEPTVAALARAVQKRLETSDDPEAPAAPPLTRRAEGTPPPLSFGQERLWFLDQLEPGGNAYNMPAALHLDGDLDVAALAAALSTVVARHEVLRTRFEDRGGEPRARVVEALGQELPVIDLGRLGEAAPEEAQRLGRREGARPFDLARGPLLRTLLLRLEDPSADARRHRLLFTFHHIVSDGWSTDLFLDELVQLYAAPVATRASALPPLAIHYGDFAAWQRAWFEGPVLETQLAYWRRHLEGAPAVLELPADRPRPARPSYRGGRAAVRVTPALAQRLGELGRRHGATPFMLHLAAFALLLHRWSAQSDVVVGTPVAGRRQIELEPLIGFFVNTLALRLGFAGARDGGGPGFGELLRRVREAALGAYGHQELPFERLVDELRPERHLSHNPIFQVLFVLHHAARPAAPMPGLALRLPSVDAGTSRLDLTLSLTELAASSEPSGGYGGFLEYARDLFDAATAERMVTHLERLLAAVAEDPAAAVDRLPLLSAAEREQILVEWNDTAVDFTVSFTGSFTGSFAAEDPEGRPVHRLFEAHAAAHPEAPALVFDDEVWSYHRLDTEADALARRLSALGVGPEVLVAVALERSPRLVVALLAVLKSGGAYVPLDPEYPAERLAFMVADAAPRVLLVERATTELVPDAATGGVTRVDLDAPTSATEAATEPATESATGPRQDPPLDDQSAAYVIYTSGSTGRPKGVVNTHGALRNRLLWMQRTYPIGALDAVLQKTPYSFDVSVWELFWPLLAGARLVVARPGGHREPEYLTSAIGRHGVTTMHFVPSMLQAFLEAPDLGPCTVLRQVFASGEALPAELVRRFFERLGAVGNRDVELHNLYGPTEAAIDVTYHRCTASERVTPIGRPVANTRVHVLDRHSAPQPVGIPGELYLGGVQLARGYARRPALTAERFVPDPFATGSPASRAGERLYRTGDLVRYRGDGEIEFLGRLDHQVKLRGLRIELGEIEAALEALPEVRECAVVVREDVPGDQRLVAYVVPEVAAAEGDLRAALRRRLPDYMVPGIFVELEALPLGPTGKLDRKALPAPEPVVSTAAQPPRTPVEEQLAAIWCQVLRRDAVGVFDNFFDLGGHSLLATQVVARIREGMGVELAVRALFEEPTIAGLAEAMVAREMADADQELLAQLLAELENEAESEEEAAGA